MSGKLRFFTGYNEKSAKQDSYKMLTYAYIQEAIQKVIINLSERTYIIQAKLRTDYSFHKIKGS